MANTNLESSTRDLFLRTVVNQVFLAMPLQARLLDARQIVWNGGLKIKSPIVTAEMDDLAQSYTANEGLTAETKTMLSTAEFNWKHFQVPVQYGLDEELQNGGGTETQIMNFVTFLVNKAQKAARIKLYKMMYENPDSSCDSTAGFQGLTDALNHDNTYGGITRATTVTNAFWQGASLDGTYADQDAQLSPSLSNFRKMVRVCQRRAERPKDYLAVCGGDIFGQLQSQVEASTNYPRTNQTPLAMKYGFTTLDIDGIEVVHDPGLDLNYTAGTTTAGTYTPEWFFLLHIPDWELRLHPDRSMKMTDFTWQADQANGLDARLARVLTSGNLICWQPNASCWRSYVA